jgi:hypothetical protein
VLLVAANSKCVSTVHQVLSISHTSAVSLMRRAASVWHTAFGLLGSLTSVLTCVVVSWGIRVLQAKAGALSGGQ